MGKLYAPTSTTTEQSVACSFGQSGIVMKLESADSNKYVKTLDMALFTCFENEAEHLIFESNLHIKDIFVPGIRCWIGNRIMNTLTLYDQLINNQHVDDERLLKQKNQQRLVKLLKYIKNDSISSYTQFKYANAMIASLVLENDEITFNMSNENTLMPELAQLFVADQDNDGPFSIILKTKKTAICKLLID